MLETLKIKNIAVIDSAEIPFKSGLNILSGETGAGKSIVIEAISLLLGSRASADLVRAGCDEAVVEGVFDISQLSWAKERLETLGIAQNNDQLLIKRTVHRAGKHRISINGELATLSNLQTLCQGLIDLCSQHEHQSLVKPSTQLELLDRFGGLTQEALKFRELFVRHRELKRQRDELANSEANRLKSADFLKFQIDELTEAGLEKGEDEALQGEKLLLQSAHSRLQHAEAVRQILESADSHTPGCLNSLQTALTRLKTLSQIDEKTAPIREALERALAETEEASHLLSRYLHGVDMDPDRLSTVQERLARIAELRRKYGTTVDDMLTTFQTLQAEFQTLGQAGERLGEIDAELDKTRSQLEKAAHKLSKARAKVAQTLADSVTAELKDLRMGDAHFHIELGSCAEIDSWNETGADTIQFSVQTNRGEPARALGKIASGGELSRLMLAIRRVIADRGGIGVYLFDEIDAGMGGQTAFQVGKKLKSVAKYNQVICITHLPQVASFGDQHLVVKKSSNDKRTLTEVTELSQKERKEELARMLGGEQITKKSLENAAELIKMAASL